MKKILAILLATVCCVSFVACQNKTASSDEGKNIGSPTENVAANADYFEWSPIYETQIVGYSEEGLKQETLVIPASCTEVQGLSNNTTVKYIRFENPETVIYSYTFNGCTELESIELPEKLAELENNVFYGCSSLKEISIPSTVTRIGKSTFEYCTSLASVVIPGSVKTVDASAFEECSSLENVTFEDGIETVGESAFIHCSALKKIVLPESVKSVMNYAFAYCDALEEIRLPKSAELIETFGIAQEHAFKLYVKEGSYADTHFDSLGGVELCEKLYG